MAGLPIRQDYTPSNLRTRATHEKDCRAALRLLAIANALEGMTRAEAARLAGMERQALHDAIQRFNAEGPDGLHDRPRTGRARARDDHAAAFAAGVTPAEPGGAGLALPARALSLASYAQRV